MSSRQEGPRKATGVGGLGASIEKFGVWLLLVGYFLFYAAIHWLVNEYVMTPGLSWEAGENILDGPIAEGRARHWIEYLLIQVRVIVKAGFTAVCLFLGTTFALWEVRFSDLFRAAMQAEIVWVLVAVIHLVWALFFMEPRTVEAYVSFYPLSAINFIEIKAESFWMYYILKRVNAFELAYMALIVGAMRLVVSRPRHEIAGMVLISYGGGTILSMAAMVFFFITFF